MVVENKGMLKNAHNSYYLITSIKAENIDKKEGILEQKKQR